MLKNFTTKILVIILAVNQTINMKKTLLALLTILLFSYSAFSQTNSAKGTIADLSANAKLHNATISVLNAKDSTLYKFTRAATDGNFSFGQMKNGSFILLVTYPEYADFVNKFTLDSANKSIDFKVIDMKTKAKLLNEVIIKGQAAAIKIKGDTTEFNAAAYKIQPNDRVEDLLKKFPGVTVDAQGKITAQGKTVEKVLVDGEEFFGDDPTLVTKNLRADMVDKVQLFEKASDQAAFTGVDDGEKKQTLNIVLKDDKKQGYFGKVDAGYGTDDFYQIQAMINKFKNKEKIAAYFTSSNTGKTGLDWNDADRFGASSNMEMTDDGMIFFSTGGDELDGGGRYWGEGIPTAHNGGIHYENKWKNDKHSLNTNYKAGSLNVKTDKNTINQNNLIGGLIVTNSDDNRESDLFRQKLDATYNVKLDTSSNLKIVIDGTLKNTELESTFGSESKRGDQSLINTSERITANEGRQQLFNWNALYTKKLKKAGRNFSINLSQNYSKNNIDGNLYSVNNFYDEAGSFVRKEEIDQLNDNDVVMNKLATNLTYTEPLSKFLSLVASYGISSSSNDAHRKTYDRGLSGDYDQLNTTFSNNFQSDQLIHQVGAIFNYKKGKTVVNFGTKTSFVNFDQVEQYSNQTFNRNFINWLPQAMYQYKFSAQKSFTFRYNGSTTQPTVNQLQPVRTNDDPLNLPEGNPLLKPAYNNRFNIRYNTYKVISSQNFYISANGGFVNNAIVSSNVTDLEGRTIYKSVNLEDATPVNYNTYLGFSRKLKFLFDINAGLELSSGGSSNYNYVFDNTTNLTQLNKTNSINFGPSLNLSKYGEKNSFYLSFGPRYRSQVASLQKNLSNQGWGYNGYFDAQLKLPKKIRFSLNSEYTYQPSTQSFDNNLERLIINATLTKAFFKQESLKLSFSANDMLDENKGFNRYASGSSIIQTTYNNIGQYFMFSIIWDFNKMGGGTPKTN